LPVVALVALGGLPWVGFELARARGAYPWRDAAARTRLLHATVALVLAATTFAARVVATRAA
jgi:hypothetical protein